MRDFNTVTTSNCARADLSLPVTVRVGRGRYVIRRMRRRWMIEKYKLIDQMDRRRMYLHPTATIEHLGMTVAQALDTLTPNPTYDRYRVRRPARIEVGGIVWTLEVGRGLLRINGEDFAWHVDHTQRVAIITDHTSNGALGFLVSELAARAKFILSFGRATA